jgi:hypothetical protein
MQEGQSTSAGSSSSTAELFGHERGAFTGAEPGDGAGAEARGSPLVVGAGVVLDHERWNQRISATRHRMRLREKAAHQLTGRLLAQL